MTKKIIVGAVILLAAAWVVKKTQVCSYAKTIFQNGAQQVRGQIPRELELARIENEIGQLDNDYRKQLRTIAEKMTAIKKLNQDIANTEVSRKERADSLVALTQAIEGKKTPIEYNGLVYTSLANAEKKADTEFQTLQRQDRTLESLKKTLEAEQSNLAALKDQLDKLVTQKHEFQVRVAQLRADEARLQAARTKTPLKVDDSRVADIKNALDRIEQEQDVDHNERAVADQYGATIDNHTPAVRISPPVNLQKIRDYVQGKQSQDGKDTKVAQQSK